MKEVKIEYVLYLPNGDIRSLKTSIPILNLSKYEIFVYDDISYIVNDVITSYKDAEIIIRYDLIYVEK